MKRILFLILSIVLCVPLVAYAHPGRTDSNGGHTNRSTGEYHYHHGYSAHDHYDSDGDGDIDCPYDFDDRTGVKTSTSITDQADGKTADTNIVIMIVAFALMALIFFFKFLI